MLRTMSKQMPGWVAGRCRETPRSSAAISGSICVSTFKAAFGRTRPDTACAELVATGPGFPSGHATMSAVVFLTLGTLVASTRTLWIERMYIV